ncbi:MAG TPA: sigma-70 family RNA polymerase sigma factor, partial [Alphaproteobacteria bacterium]|nr:sigma-70 family RNA polymerase sigma factor [Alphaproteobacteria bacterium]
TGRRDRKTHLAWLNEAMETLSERERRVIESRFLGEDKTTLAEIGEAFGVTKERIRQIERQALVKLRTAMKAHVPEGAELFGA